MSEAIQAVLDNDVILKCASWSLLDAVSKAYGGKGSTGVLGEAKYVVPHYLVSRFGVVDKARSLSEFRSFIEEASVLEPTTEEVELATTLEERAIVEGWDLDSGESLLCAILTVRCLPRLVTGDKRAVKALEVAVIHLHVLRWLGGRIATLEQVMLALVELLGASDVRRLVCAEPHVDSAMKICFECGGATRDGFHPEGLESYISAMRADAPSLLCRDAEVFP